MMPTDPAGQQNRPRVVLLATDRSNSVIGEIVDSTVNTIAYSAYGEQSAQQDVATRVGFNGELRETTFGWYLLGNGYRAYNPRLMRFHSPDSWSPFGVGGLNAYMFCSGDPANHSDATGHALTPLLSAAFANLTDNISSFFTTYRRHASENPVTALLSSINGRLSDPLGVPTPLTFSRTAPTSGSFKAKDGWLHHKVGGVPSSTPDRGSNASLPGSSGGGSMWERLAARNQSTQVAVVSPNYGRTTQAAVVRPNQSATLPTGAAPRPAQPVVTARIGAAVQPSRHGTSGGTSSTWSGESGPSDWSTSSSNSSIRGSRS
ncbi:MAG: sugar-binding protein [Pseudomonas sp.]|nr:sugar-binding protein [Pseudomonas sp.]